MGEEIPFGVNHLPPEAGLEPLPEPSRFHLKKWEVWTAAVAIALAGGILIFYRSYIGGPASRAYGEVYQLVPDKISRSAAIAISLPKSVDAEEAKSKITFDPPIEGTWLASDSKERVIFRPKKELELGRYYAVALNFETAKIAKDFLADENPKITAVFPAADAEAPEKSEITIVFNRPMVALSTLDRLMGEGVPVEITPKTPGKFKWTTTRNLQFIPEKRLARSSRYTVKIGSGFVSMDGLEVAGLTHNFTTRPMRYVHSSSGTVLYDRPVVIAFNQPFDLERTKREIKVTKIPAGEDIAFNASYGTRTKVDPATGDKTKIVDRSILEIYGARDRFDRKNFWDFNTNYRFNLARAYPLEGDVILEEGRGGDIHVPEIIENLGAESPRSRHVRPEAFDPEGKIWVSFFEEVDKDRLRVSAPHLKEISYGEKCKTDEEGLTVYLGSGCEKVADYKKIYLAFDGGKFKPGEPVAIQFKSIVNRGRLALNAETITKTAAVYPELKITRVAPANGESGAKLTELKICSTSPLKPADESNFAERVKSNLPLGLWNWYEPFLVIDPGFGFPSPFGSGFGAPSPFAAPRSQSPCKGGEFENTIYYGLIPQSDYRINLNLVDDFGQRASANVSFQSGNLPEFSLNFFHLQKRYSVTSPERTKLVYGAENFEFVDLDICEVSAETMLAYTQEYPDDTLPPSLLNCIRHITKRIELPPKFWVRNYFQVNLRDYIGDAVGHFVLTLGHPQYYRRAYRDKDFPDAPAAERLYERTFITVTRLAVQEKKVEWEEGSPYYADSSPAVVRKALEGSRQNLYWVTEVGTLDPIVGASVALYQKGVVRAGPETLTDGQGVARLDPVPDLIGAVVRSGGDSAIVSSRVDKLQWASPAFSAERTYIYTDRPIYRPGQEVFIKGLHRVGYDGNYEILRDKKAGVNVTNSRGDEVFAAVLDINEFGTFNTGFVIDAKASLGTYYIEALGGYGYFDVEEYSAAAFKVETKSDKEEYVAGETAKLSVDAAYYFGVPVEGGEVTYSVLSQDYYFDRYGDGYFSFGRGWYYSYNSSYGDKFISRGKTALNREGRAEFEIPLDFSKFFKDEEGKRSKIFVVNATVQNQDGQSIFRQQSFIVHRGELYLGVNLDKNFLAKGDKATVRVKSVDVKGEPLAKRGITLEINKIKWEYFRRREVDGRYYYRTEKKVENVRKTMLSADSRGDASHEWTFDEEGEYEAVVKTDDGRGNTVEAVRDFYVSGPGAVVVRPTNNEALDLATDKSKVDVGENVKVIIKSPYQKAKALVALERGKIFRYDIVDVNRNLTEYSFEVKEEYLPNVYLTVLLLSPRPEIKYGQINYEVSSKRAALKIEVKTDKNVYLPGEKINLSVTARDWRDRPVAAEVSVAVADVSVLALKGNPKKDPVVFFYGSMPLVVSTASNVKNILYEAEVPVGTKGGGGGEPEDLAKKRRGTFKDTSYWQAVLRTDSNGRAAVSFVLPDNLTTWQAETVGITKDTKLGAGYQEFTTRKELMAVPLKPRFVIPGDEFSIGAQIFNETGERQKLEVALSSSTLEITGKKSLAVSLGARDTVTVYFPVRAPESTRDGNHTFVISAKNKDHEDTVEQSIAITRNETYEAVAAANYTSSSEAREYFYIPAGVSADRGGVEVKASATLAVYLSDALNYLVDYPYGCSEQIASKLSSIAVVKKSLNVKNVGGQFNLRDVEFGGNRYSVDDVVKIGLARIYENQTPGGGFTYYQGLQPNFYLTLHIINTLSDLKRAGYGVNDEAMLRGARYLASELNGNPMLYQSKDNVILAAYAISRVDGFSGYADLKNRVVALANDVKFIREDIANASLTYLAVLLSGGYQESLKDSVFQALENRIDVDSRGAHLKVSKNAFYDYYETPVKDTALLLKAIAADRRENPVNDKILRWLIASRAKDGAWGSSANTAAVVDAMSDFLEWKRETESEFSLKLDLDGKEQARLDFNRESIFKSLEAFIPMENLGLEKLLGMTFRKENKNTLPNNYYYDLSLKYYLPIDQISPRDEGFAVSREFYRLRDKEMENPVEDARQGEVLKGRLVITVPQAKSFVAVEDFIPAGMEIVNFRLATEDQTLKQSSEEDNIRYYEGGYDYGDACCARNETLGLFAGISAGARPFLSFLGLDFGGWFGGTSYDEESGEPPAASFFSPDADEVHDDRLFLFKERVLPGVYRYDYYVRSLIPGKYRHLPAVASEMYFPENFGRTRGGYFKILAE